MIDISKLQAYEGKLDACSAATGLQAARLNASDLVGSSQLLFNAKKYHHSVALSTLAIEECGKIPIILSIFLELDDSKKIWKKYRHHRSKSNYLNTAVVAMAQAEFPNLDKKNLNMISQGPIPLYLDVMKQLAFYTDCISTHEGHMWHLPRDRDWQVEAKERLDEARAMALKLRDYPPTELDIWHKHLAKYNRKNKEELKTAFKKLKEELLGKGFIGEGWWTPILKAIDEM
jgi:AbiV family abortive infection protein